VIWPSPVSSANNQYLQAGSTLLNAGVSLAGYGITATNDIQGLSTASANSVGAYSQ
jgi:hypothetical protein